MASKHDDDIEHTNTERDGSVEALGHMLIGASVIAIVAIAAVVVLLMR